jgi:radical SAM superfamily enzyme YgiQ (UPF0313 family)
MHKLKILFGDLGYFNKFTRQTNYIPLNIGYVAQYTKSLYSEDVDVRLFKNAEKLLTDASHSRPDVVALSFYYWNADLNYVLVKKLRALYGADLTIVWGGPSVSDNHLELSDLFIRYPLVNAFVINEGELGFANIVGGILSNAGSVWNSPIDGAVFRGNGKSKLSSNGKIAEDIVLGRPVGLTLDLSTLDSPYLSGMLDEFLVGEYMPMLQTSRLCPYTCAFCTSGKNKGKLRAFPMEQVKAEIDLLCARFADRPYMQLLLSDENFGILKRDVELAEYILESKKRTGYPKSIFFYNDKRFTDTSKKVIETLGDINMHGLVLSLQSENPETLKEVKRRNLSPEDIASALKWASDRNMPTSTELIFGMPYETRQSFTDLLRSCVDKGFDTILGFNLFLMDGIAINTPQSRQKHEIKTMFRPVGTYYGLLDGEFTAETEELVTSTKYFTFDDYLLIRSLNFMYYSVFALYFNRWFFQYIRHSGIDVSKFMQEFIAPTGDVSQLAPGHLKFSEDIHNAFRGELFDSREEARAHLKSLFEANSLQVKDPIRHNVYYGSRLIYLEGNWVESGLMSTLNKFLPTEGGNDIVCTAKNILRLCVNERIPLREGGEPSPVSVDYNYIAWQADKFNRPLSDYSIGTAQLHYSASQDTLERLASFRSEFSHYQDAGFYYEAMDFMNRRELIYKMTIE